MGWILLLAGFFNIGFSFLISDMENVVNAMVFKILPFCFGVVIVIFAVKTITFG